MPNQERTPRRTIRVPDPLWGAARWVAEAKDETVTKVVNDALEAYVKAAGVIVDASYATFARPKRRRST